MKVAVRTYGGDEVGENWILASLEISENFIRGIRKAGGVRRMSEVFGAAKVAAPRSCIRALIGQRFRDEGASVACTGALIGRRFHSDGASNAYINAICQQVA